MESYREVQAYGKEVVLVPFHFTTDGSGDPTLVIDGGGVIVSVARSTGSYRLTFDVPFGTFLGGDAIVLAATANKNKLQIKAEDVNGATPYVDLMNAAPTATAASGAYNENTTTVLADLVRSGAFPHQAGTTPTLITAPDADSGASAITLSNALKVFLEAHDDDTNIHPTADTGALAVAAPTPTDTASTSTALNEMKADWNTHAAKISSGTTYYHTGSDPRHLITAANGSSDATNYVLANEMKAKFNDSVISKPPAATTLLESGGTQTQATLTTATSEAALLSAAVTGVLFMTKG